MKSVNAPVIEDHEFGRRSSSSMSGYESDLEDVEIQLRRELIRLDVRPSIVVQAVREESSIQEYYQR